MKSSKKEYQDALDAIKTIAYNLDVCLNITIHAKHINKLQELIDTLPEEETNGTID